VETTYKRAEEFAELIKETKNFELLFEPQSNIVCFRYIPEGINSEEKLNAINAEIRKKLTEDGTFYIVQTKLNNKIYLRTTIMNPFTKISDLKKLLGLITIMS
jgi:L-2,4-diaminobutyrate decarboxylase